jgi:hypothetical protein
MGRNCSDALNALVRCIVCAVGLREAPAAICVLLVVALLRFVVLPEPLVFVPVLLVFPAAVFPAVWVLVEGVVFSVLAGFFA